MCSFGIILTWGWWELHLKLQSYLKLVFCVCVSRLSLWLFFSEGTRLTTKLDLIWLQFCVASGEIFTMKPDWMVRWAWLWSDTNCTRKNSNMVCVSTVTHASTPPQNVEDEGNKKSLNDRMVKLYWISMASCECMCVCEGEILQRSQESASPHRGGKILQPALR